MLYIARKHLVKKLSLPRMIGERLFNYCKYAVKTSALEDAHRVINGGLRGSGFPLKYFQIN
ncbi:MAG: hypothetical protein JO297_04160 [Nitrososphaeraceae archaeon]|nr:hypothetical protein [Nitrososphaeraceae archaeon]